MYYEPLVVNLTFSFESTCSIDSFVMLVILIWQEVLVHVLDSVHAPANVRFPCYLQRESILYDGAIK